MKRQWVPMLLLALAAGFFWRLWPMPDGFLYRPNSLYSDLTITHWPNTLFIRHSLATWGQIPLWRPLILGGEPFAANPLSGLWYPPYLLLLVLPLTPAFNLLFVLHMAWAGWGGYRLARATGASLGGGLFCAFTLMFAPKAVAHLASGHIGLFCAWAWLPWAFWAVRRLAERGRLTDVAVAGAALGMLILADVRLAFYGGLAAAGYWLIGVGRRTRRRPVLPLAATVVLAAALVAVQAVPLAMVAGRLNRGGLSLEESGIASLPPRYLVGLLVADHGGFQEWMTYVGAAGLLLAGMGLARWKGRQRWWWGGLALAAGVYSLGTYTPLYAILYRIVPPLAWLRGPARAWFLVVLAVGVLAAQGLTGMTGGVRRRRAGLAAAALGMAAVVGGLGGLALHLPVNLAAAAVVWPTAGALLALGAGGRLHRSICAGLLVGLALADLWGVGFTLYRVRPAEDVLAEGRQAAAWLAAQPGRFRVYSPSYSIPQHVGAAYGIEMVDGVDPFQLADYVAFMRYATGVDIPGYSVTVPPFPEVASEEDMLLAHREAVPDLRLLGLLNVRYLAAAYPMEVEGLTALGEWGGVYLYQNGRALPRAFVVGRVETVEGLDGALAWLAENDPGEVAVVERGGGEIRRHGDAETRRRGEGESGEARIVEWSPNRIEVEAEGPGLLVLSEVYDPDWRVEVDGQEREMARADGILRGVYLKEGRHRVVFIYWPVGLGIGIGVTMTGVACIFILWIVGMRKAHRCG